MSNDWRDLPTMADVAAAQAAGDEIHFLGAGCIEWEDWCGYVWHDAWSFRARPRQKTKKVKMLCYLVDGYRLNWLVETAATTAREVRVPIQDIDIEVEE